MMLFGHDRDRIRSLYCKAWRLHREAQPLEPLQAQIAAVIQCHPEYHSLLEDPDKALSRDYPPELGETNPFLHMGMHLAIQEQVGTDRPAGIRELYRCLCGKYPDSHSLEHRLMECFAEMLWLAQRDGEPADEQRYLDCIRAIAREYR